VGIDAQEDFQLRIPGKTHFQLRIPVSAHFCHREFLGQNISHRSISEEHTILYGRNVLSLQF